MLQCQPHHPIDNPARSCYDIPNCRCPLSAPRGANPNASGDLRKQLFRNYKDHNLLALSLGSIDHRRKAQVATAQNSRNVRQMADCYALIASALIDLS